MIRENVCWHFFFHLSFCFWFDVFLFPKKNGEIIMVVLYTSLARVFRNIIITPRTECGKNQPKKRASHRKVLVALTLYLNIHILKRQPAQRSHRLFSLVVIPSTFFSSFWKRNFFFYQRTALYNIKQQTHAVIIRVMIIILNNTATTLKIKWKRQRKGNCEKKNFIRREKCLFVRVNCILPFDFSRFRINVKIK